MSTLGASRLALTLTIALVIAGLATFDKFLASAQEAAVEQLARRSYLDGLVERRAGKTNEAVEAFRKAHALERGNTEYELELTDALIAAGKRDQADLLMRELLDEEPNDGRANLLAAHLMIAEERIAEAESYYHRAIYGEWPSDAIAHQIAVRMELADFLAGKGKQQELLAELLPLQEQTRNTPALERPIAQLFLAAGSPSRAVDEYWALIKQNPKDAAAHVGLGEAELQRGEYRAAHEAFADAATQKPDDDSIRHKLQLSSTLMALDPTPRKLTSMEKYQRSLRILDRTRSDLEECIASHPALDSEATEELLISANNVLTGTIPASVTNETAENVLGLAEKAWQTRLKACGASISPNEEPLRLIFQRLAQ
ncbi:MAG: tetratricopeptide repeat protein [Bryobacteraceae bacterium]